MIKTTRRGLFPYLTAALAWFFGRRVTATPDVLGSAQSEQPIAAGVSSREPSEATTGAIPPGGGPVAFATVGTVVYSTYLGGSSWAPED